jgi:hypothetical protein
MLNRIDLLKQRQAMRRRIRVEVAIRRLTTTPIEPVAEPVVEGRNR